MQGKAIQKPQKTHGGKPQEDDKEIRSHGYDPERNELESPKFTTEVQVWLSSLLNSLVEGTTLLNAMTKCGGIESGEDPKTHF